MKVFSFFIIAIVMVLMFILQKVFRTSNETSNFPTQKKQTSLLFYLKAYWQLYLCGICAVLAMLTLAWLINCTLLNAISDTLNAKTVLYQVFLFFTASGLLIILYKVKKGSKAYLAWSFILSATATAYVIHYGVTNLATDASNFVFTLFFYILLLAVTAVLSFSKSSSKVRFAGSLITITTITAASTYILTHI